METPFVDRIIFASIVASAVTVWGENLLPAVSAPPVRRLDVFKALFGFSSQVLLSAVTFPVLHDATKYSIGALKHSLHSCYFCYHGRTAALEVEVGSSVRAWHERYRGGASYRLPVPAVVRVRSDAC
jgi:hypothetical protein